MRLKNELTDTYYDATIVGGGLSGLAAGIRLQLLGEKTLIVEQQPRLGGLCRSVSINNKSFEIGCNDFGSSIEAQLAELDVEHNFKKVKNHFIFGDKVLISPFDRQALLTVLGYPADLVRFLYLMVKANGKAKLPTITDRLHNATFRNMIHALLAYFSFRPVEKIDIAFAKRLLGSPYGYDSPRVPVGGTQALIDAMRERYESLGGEIRLNTKFISASPHFFSEDSKYVKLLNTQTNKKYKLQSKLVVSSYHGWEQYPATAQPAFSIAALLICVDKRFALPKDVHTFVFAPPSIERFLSEHDQGVLSEQPCFHWFQNHPIEPVGDTYALTAYLLWPRDMQHTAEVENKIVDYMLHTTDNYFPGFKEAISGDIIFIAPHQYQEKFGMDSCLALRSSEEIVSVPCYNREQDMYYIGNALNKPEDQHAGGALNSAKETVNKIMAREFSVSLNANAQARRLPGGIVATALVSLLGITAAIALFSFLNSWDGLSGYFSSHAFWGVDTPFAGDNTNTNGDDYFDDTAYGLS